MLQVNKLNHNFEPIHCGLRAPECCVDCAVGLEIADEPLDGSSPSAFCAPERIEPLPFRAALLEPALFPELTNLQRRAVEMLGGVWERADFGNDTSACSAQIDGIALPVQVPGPLVALTR
jgi:hypothetical protein